MPVARTQHPGDDTPVLEKQKEVAIKRPPNSFFLYKSFYARVRVPEEARKLNFIEASRTIGKEWKNVNEAEQKIWIEAAAEVAAMHKVLYPEYKYRPKKKSDVETKSKVRNKCKPCDAQAVVFNDYVESLLQRIAKQKGVELKHSKRPHYISASAASPSSSGGTSPPQSIPEENVSGHSLPPFINTPLFGGMGYMAPAGSATPAAAPSMRFNPYLAHAQTIEGIAPQFNGNYGNLVGVNFNTELSPEDFFTVSLAAPSEFLLHPMLMSAAFGEPVGSVHDSTWSNAFDATMYAFPGTSGIEDMYNAPPLPV